MPAATAVHTVATTHGPDVVGAYLRANARLLAVVATARTQQLLSAREGVDTFPAVTVPSVEVRAPRADELGCVTIDWVQHHGGGEHHGASPWPASGATLVPYCSTEGSRLALFASRTAETDQAAPPAGSAADRALPAQALEDFLTTIAWLVDASA